MKKGWDKKKLEVMATGLRYKFENPKLRQMLLDTGTAVLHEDNPEDFYWAIADGTGKSWLGKMLMMVRGEIYLSSHTSEIDDTNPEEFERLGHREVEE